MRTSVFKRVKICKRFVPVWQTSYSDYCLVSCCFELGGEGGGAGHALDVTCKFYLVMINTPYSVIFLTESYLLNKDKTPLDE